MSCLVFYYYHNDNDFESHNDDDNNTYHNNHNRYNNHNDVNLDTSIVFTLNDIYFYSFKSIIKQCQYIMIHSLLYIYSNI